MAADPESRFNHSILVCVDCQEEFVFTASAQKYFAERGFVDPPKRCRTCYNAFKTGGGSSEDAGGPPLPPQGLDNGSRLRPRT